MCVCVCVAWKRFSVACWRFLFVFRFTPFLVPHLDSQQFYLFCVYEQLAGLAATRSTEKSGLTH